LSPTATLMPTELPAYSPTLNSPAATLVLARPTVSTPPPTATSVPAVPPTPGLSTQPAAEPQVTLVNPPDGFVPPVGNVTFAWETSVVLASDQAFELVFWPDGGDPLADGHGPSGTTLDSTMEVKNMSEVFANRAVIPDSNLTYRWGILLVETQPAYRRLQYLRSLGASTAPPNPTTTKPPNTPDQ